MPEVDFWYMVEVNKHARWIQLWLKTWPITNAVSVFRRFLTRYFNICQFLLLYSAVYCGNGNPPMSPSESTRLHFPVRDARCERRKILTLKCPSSHWNPTPNPSQYVLVSFHLISQAIRPLQPTPSGNFFFKNPSKKMQKSPCTPGEALGYFLVWCRPGLQIGTPF